MAEDGEQGLFQGVLFSVIPSDDLQESDDELFKSIRAGGGRQLPIDDLKLDRLDELTHVISTHVDFPQYNAALERGINVVKPSWIAQSLAKGRLAQVRQHSPDPSQFFNEVVVTTAGLPQGDKDALLAGVIALGGQYSSALSRLVTHIVTMDPDNNEKCKVAKEKQLDVKIVLPHWFDDCFRLGKKIAERPYLFPHPEILRSENNSKIQGTASPYIDGAIAAQPITPPTSHLPTSSPSVNRKKLSALANRTIMLSADLLLSDHLKRTIEGLILQSGGSLSHDVKTADIYIGQYRDGDDYIEASRSGKEVANLSWLYHVINRNRYTNPLSKLLHYPIPRNGIPGFENMRISISNYQGDARIYLENLVLHSGAVFTKTMKQDNTHLITAHMTSDKVDAAQEWNLHIVNHLWLEESYAKCAVQTLTNPRYQTFPVRTNLGEVTGLTSFDMKRVERMYFPQPVSSPAPIKSANMTAPVPEPRITGAASTPAFNTNNNDEIGIASIKNPRGRPPKANATPARKFGDDEKENHAQILLSSGRTSKIKALGLLHKQADDIALFNKEMKRKGGVTHGRRVSGDQDAMLSPVPAPRSTKKRLSGEAARDISAEESACSDEEIQPVAKRAKKTKKPDLQSALPPIMCRMMVTGDERWHENPKKESNDCAKLRHIGVQLVQDPRKVDVLVAPKILRTRKFVAALAGAPHVVHTSYLDTALSKGKLMENPPLLEDPDSEMKFGFSLKAALERARSLKGTLLRSWSIYVTKTITGGFETYNDIITANGGVALLYQGRIGVTLPKPPISDVQQSGDDPNAFGYVYLVSGSSEAESKVWAPFTKLAAKSGVRARVVKADWLLTTSMSQQITWNESWLLRDSSGDQD